MVCRLDYLGLSNANVAMLTVNRAGTSQQLLNYSSLPFPSVPSSDPVRTQEDKHLQIIVHSLKLFAFCLPLDVNKMPEMQISSFLDNSLRFLSKLISYFTAIDYLIFINVNCDIYKKLCFHQNITFAFFL